MNKSKALSPALLKGTSMLLVNRRRPALAVIVLSVSLIVSGMTAIGIDSNANLTKTLVVTGFAENAVSLNNSMSSQIRKFIKENPDFNRVTCVGFSDRFGLASTNSYLGQSRAQNGCNLALQHNSKLKVSSIRGKWDQTSWGLNIRRVKITLAYSDNVRFTTQFNYQGGSGSLGTEKVRVGDSVALPEATKTGHEFLGWFNKETDGVLLGHAGALFAPDGNQVLWARWAVSVPVRQPSAQEPSPSPSPSFSASPSPSPSPTPSPSPSPERTFTVTGTGALSLVFGPVAGVSNQYIWFCSPGVQATVCSSSIDTQVNGTDLKEVKVNPYADDPIAGTFNVTAKAPGTRPAGYVVGPGVGISCTMRSGGSIVGTANGAGGADWTGSGLMSTEEKRAYGLNEAAEIYWFNYWFTGCTLDVGVTAAKFYNEYRVPVVG